MKNVAKDIGVEDPKKEEVEEVLKELDENGDGKLSLDEYTINIHYFLTYFFRFTVLIQQVLEMMSASQ